MEPPPSKAQIDRLGEQLRRETYGEAELRLLDEYRRGFGDAYDAVVETIQRFGTFRTSMRSNIKQYSKTWTG